MNILFCYLPFEKISLKDSLRSFMEYFLSHMAHSEQEGTQKCYEVYELCQQENVQLESVLQILFEDADAVCVREETEPQKVSAERNIMKEVPQKLQDKIQDKKIIQYFFDKMQRKKKMEQEIYEFGPEDYQTETSNPTVFLGSETEQILGELKYEGEGDEKNMVIASSMFLIGSHREETDGVIHNDTVSRVHARITKENDCYYLEDMNSTNGTYRNGELLNYKEKVLLVKNDKISFAKENYRLV